MVRAKKKNQLVQKSPPPPRGHPASRVRNDQGRGPGGHELGQHAHGSGRVTVGGVGRLVLGLDVHHDVAVHVDTFEKAEA